MNYRTSLLPQEHAASVIETLLKVISTTLDHPKTLVGELDYLSEHDRDRVYEWNRDWPEMVAECAHEKIMRQVEQQPDALAIISSEENFTYRELDELSTRMAHYLVERGVGPEVIVPLCFQKSAWAIVAMLGVMKAGGALVFLDPSHPIPRLEEILSQVKSQFVVTSPTTAGLWTSLPFDIFIVTRNSIEALPYYLHPPTSHVTASNAMYVVFTSGSTGKPKGCVIEHKNFCSGATRHAKASEMGPGSRISQFASYTFDVSILEIVTALLAGASICVPGPESLSKGLASAINEFGITWTFLTPSLARLIKPGDVPSLRTLALGGEALSKLEVETWADKLQLINGYGPSECSIAAAANVEMSSTTDPTNIGRAIGGVCWIVDADNHDRLAPIGAAGELLIQGPILARGYLDNPGKTTEVFIDNPAWIEKRPSGKTRRFYKTGDLVRYNSDGTLRFIGRKDTQIKLRGQRIELGEIEHHLVVDDNVNLAMVVLPKSGPCKRKLVAILSLNKFQAPSRSAEGGIRIISIKAELPALIQKIRENLSALVPLYMVPTVWIAVEDIPLMSSGKMNRVKVSQWVVNMDEDMYLELVGVESNGEANTSFGTESERLLQKAYSEVLNLKLDLILLNRSFLSLGGDSISAMQVMARCREEGFSLSIRDILRSKSISELALCLGKIEESLITAPEHFDTPFDLSPVQQMYFATATEEGSSNHYNQSFFLQMVQRVPEEVLYVSIEAIISRHSMLRARFDKGQDGQWSQHIPEKVENSYSFSHHMVESIQDAMPTIKASHEAINFRLGPVFIARLFITKDEEQFLFLVAHHLVVDLVSWRIIMQDLEKLVRGEAFPTTKPLPFQTWIDIQADYAAEKLKPKTAFPFTIPAADYNYWGIDGKSNENSDTREEIIALGLEDTELLLGSQCHAALSTEPIDLLVGALIHAFSVVFNDRKVPALFREGHGREPWTNNIDLSGTVGWFTTMYPLHVAVQGTDGIVGVVRRAKDVRHSVPANGWPYFASRFLNEEGKECFGDHNNVELSFDYLGLFQQLERDDALFRLVPQNQYASGSDVGANVNRFMLVEITAEVIEGKMQYQFLYNRYMRHQEKIRHWINQCRESLKLAIELLSTMSKQYTLSDFSLLPLTYEELNDLTERRLPQLGAKLEDVEDVYPCTPMQRGLLLSQLKAAGSYEYSHTMEIMAPALGAVDIERFRNAWGQVVSRHESLRTLFFESSDPDRLYDQVVLKKIDPWILTVRCSSKDYSSVFNEQQPVTPFMGRAPHRLSICTTPTNRVFCKLELNHAIVDGQSLPIILRDLSAAYDNILSDRKGRPFSDYVSYISGLDQDSALAYWTQYLADLECCYIRSDQPPGTHRVLRLVKLELDIDSDGLQALCEDYGVTVSNVLQTAWGLVLRQYTGMDHVSFGYLSSGRDSSVERIHDAVGPYLAMMICRLDLERTKSLIQMIETTRDDFARSLPNQYCSLADIQHSLGLSGSALFNTVMSLQKRIPIDISKDPSLLIDLLDEHDPTEVWAFLYPYCTADYISSMTYRLM